MEFLRLFLRRYFVETSGGVRKSLLFSHVNDTLTDCQTTMLFNKSNCYYFLFFQTLAGLCSGRTQWPLVPIFCSWVTSFSYKSYAGHPRFNSFRTLGSLQFSFEHSLDYWLHGLCFGKIFIVITR